jgi:ATP-binding cassette subfamily B protein
LNSNLIGARKLLEIVDAPPSEPVDDHKPALKLAEARSNFAMSRLPVGGTSRCCAA